MKRADLIDAIIAHVESREGDMLEVLRELAVDAEGALCRRALEANGWNMARASAALGQPRKTRLQQALLRRHPTIEAERRRLGPPDRRRKKGLADDTR